MGIVNKRNALLGWTAWKFAKRALKKKAKGAVPGTAEGGRAPGKPALLAGIAALVGGLWFWRKKGGGPDEGSAGPG